MHEMTACYNVSVSCTGQGMVAQVIKVVKVVNVVKVVKVVRVVRMISLDDMNSENIQGGFSAKKKNVVHPMRIFCTSRISWNRISDWLPIVFHFGTENCEEQLKKPSCTR